ncbi:MAG: two-component regulator propeller domain-containing protein [Bacteroidales bacterium]|nr:two-component regulator propeller domain-containing protein [Bacteroidales bacterium]
MVRKLLFKSTIISFLLSFNTLLSLAQTYQFKNYGINEGLPHPFIYTVNQDNNGFIWLGTGDGLCRFDGYDFHMSYVSDSMETTFPVSSYETAGGVIYFGFNDGTVHYTDNGALKKVPGINAVRVNYIIENSESEIFIISQSKGVYFFSPDKPDETLALDNPVDEFLYSAAFTPDGNMLLGTQNGLALCAYKDGELKLITEASELTYYKVQDIRQSVNPELFFIGTDDNGLYLADCSNGGIITRRLSDEDLFTRSRIQSLMLDKSGTLWISTFGKGLVKLATDSLTADIQEYEVLNERSGLSSNDIKVSYEDDWGNIWIGHFGNGVSILSSDAYKFYMPGNEGVENDIIYVGEYLGDAFAGTESGYYIFDLEKEEVTGYTELSRQVDMARISDYLINDDGSMLIGTEGQGVYRRNPQGRTEVFFRSNNNLENYISDIIDEGAYIWLGTRSGIIIIEKETGNSRRYTTSEQLPHNNIKQLLPDGKGNVIIATEADRLYFINPGEGITTGKAIIRGGMRTVFQSFDIDRRGKIWGATKTTGVYCFENDSVWGITERSGLYSNNCYSLLCDSNNNVWIGHQGGISFYNQDLDVIRTFVDIFSSGADCNDNAIYETSQGYVLIGTTEGFMVYNPEKDKSKIYPPKTNILSVSINNKKMPVKDEYNLPYSPRYTVKIDYVGLNYSDPDKVYYRYSMENYDSEWSDPTYDRTATYVLNNGSYRFNILAYSYDGISDNNIQSFVINIRKPFWNSWWFITSVLILIIGIVTVIIKVRERTQARAKKYLEDELAERTREVISQKDEIEYQNREITDSINYAQRIQASLLPPVKKLDDIFKGAYVFYRPRDIVSGDFYWFDMLSEETIIIVCADSTGHGVPGAFMSMIGSALLQEIVNRKEITRPSEILKTLDREISTTLNQTGDDKSNDGMDMVVCEFNPKTRLLRFASALRPVIIVMDGEQYYIRGNKSSVGGEYLGEKYFDDQEYYLKENDIVYIFSDGYPDQFGGPDGKKLKMVRLKRLLEEIKDLSMEEQHKRVSDYFDEWKGKLEQVDDVLLMAIKV